MNSRLLQALLGLSLLLNFFILAGFAYRTWIAPPGIEQARGPGGQFPPGQRPSPLDMLAQELQLDDKQKQELRGVFEQYANTRRDRQREIQKVREQMVVELKKSDTDFAKLEPMVEQISRLRGEQQKENLRAMVAMRPKLRPDQQDRMETLMAERLGGWWGRPRREGRPTQ